LKHGYGIPLGLLILLGACRPGAAQTFYGSSGLLVHPSAFVSEPKTASLNVTVLTQKLGSNTDTYIPNSLSYAVNNRLELGPIYVRHIQNADHAHGHAGGFLKYQLLPDTRSHPAFAIGGSYRNGDWLESYVDGTFSHNFERHGRTFLTAHTGVQWGRSKTQLGPQTDVGGFFGLEYPFAPELRLIGETSTRFSFEPSAASAIGVAWDVRSGPHVSLGFVNIGRSDNMRLFFGVGYPFGGRR
jgi:hypothetical protein